MKSFLFMLRLSIFGVPYCASAQQPSIKTTPPSVFTFNDSQKLSYIKELKFIGKEAIYTTTGWVLYSQLTLQTADGRQQVIYQDPSTAAAQEDVTHYSQVKSLGPMNALMRGNQLEVLLEAAGHFRLFRFQQSRNQWALTGIVNESDFMDDGEKWCMGGELIGLGKVQLNMNDGSKRILIIDEEGIIRENGKVHEYAHVRRPPEYASQEEYYKDRHRRLLAEYFEPRDANGVPLSYIDFITRKKAAKNTSKISAALSPVPVAKNQLDESKISKHAPETMAPVQLGPPGFIWAPVIYGAIAIACVGFLLVYFLRRK